MKTTNLQNLKIDNGRFRAIRESAGLKQFAVAEKVGIHPQSLSAFESGRRLLNADDFFRLCLYYGLISEDLAIQVEPSEPAAA